ncbi:MAG: peptide-methionine (R)-S-oxide reductase MsrB [Pseudomonadota bacterium]
MVEGDKWRQRLTPEQYRVCRQGGTEPPFTGPWLDACGPGTFSCVCCGASLFPASAKFDSGSGWPSFTAPVSPEAVTELRDDSLGMVRTEVRCAGCDAHLGHVFPDGPEPTGLRYCINGICLALEPTE